MTDALTHGSHCLCATCATTRTDHENVVQVADRYTGRMFTLTGSIHALLADAQPVADDVLVSGSVAPVHLCGRQILAVLRRISHYHDTRKPADARPAATPTPTEVPAEQAAFADQVDVVLSRLQAMLLRKNAAYGNSALDPLRVFSRAPAGEQIRVRIDDKLSRLARGSAAGEDPAWDLLGYLVLLQIAERDTDDS